MVKDTEVPFHAYCLVSTQLCDTTSTNFGFLYLLYSIEHFLLFHWLIGEKVANLPSFEVYHSFLILVLFCLLRFVVLICNSFVFFLELIIKQ